MTHVCTLCLNHTSQVCDVDPNQFIVLAVSADGDIGLYFSLAHHFAPPPPSMGDGSTPTEILSEINAKPQNNQPTLFTTLFRLIVSYSIQTVFRHTDIVFFEQLSYLGYIGKRFVVKYYKLRF